MKEDTRMGRTTFRMLTALVALLTTSCSNATDETQSLPAPANLSVSVLASSAGWGYGFQFNAVEYAESYLISYSLSDDTSTAAPLASGQFPPIGYSYSRADSYGGKTYYFWVRAYDGKNYGKWSTPISTILY